eukprot:COSAG06_NODE_265_length_18834_cov_10.938991_15_plen_107_part_00
MQDGLGAATGSEVTAVIVECSANCAACWDRLVQSRHPACDGATVDRIVPATDNGTFACRVVWWRTSLPEEGCRRHINSDTCSDNQHTREQPSESQVHPAIERHEAG